jgi:CTP synthase
MCSGTSPDERLVEAIELATDQHPFFVASQYHPEFKSRPERPAPLFREFVGAALDHAEAAGPDESALTAGQQSRGPALPSDGDGRDAAEPSVSRGAGS